MRWHDRVSGSAQAGLLAVSLFALTAQGTESRIPRITGFTPRSGPPGTLVKIIGERFDSLSALDFNGVEAEFRVVSSLHIKAIVPRGATTGPIHATSLAGTATSPISFVVPSPREDEVVPHLASWPNPARQRVTWRFTLPRPAHVHFSILDTAGRRIRVIEDAWLPAGRHERIWDVRDRHGRVVPAGVYRGRLTAEPYVLERAVTVQP